MLGVTSSPDINRRQEPSLPASPSVTSVALKSGSSTRPSSHSATSPAISSASISRSSGGPKPVKPSSIQTSPDTVGISPNVFAPVTNSAVLTSQNISAAHSRPLAAPGPDLASVTIDALNINVSQPEASFSLTQGPLSVAGLINTQVSTPAIGLSEPAFNPQTLIPSAM